MKKAAIRLAASVIALSAVFPTACSQDERGGTSVPPVETGKLKMRLETTSASGKVYRLRQAVMPITSFDFGGSGLTLRSEDDPTRAVLETFLNPGSYFVQLQDGWFIEQVDELLGTAIPVGATLLTSSFQTFSIQSDQETFVRFDFEVDGQRIGFGPPGRLVVGIGVRERGAQPGVNPRRSLIETNQTAVGAFSLEQALSAAERNSGLTADPLARYHELVDTYASAANARLPEAVHCGDETSNGSPSLNGYPLRCDRLEHQQFDNFGQWFPTAIVNRLDLAPADGAHCGQQRLIFANNAFVGNGRMFIIVEAQIPNPNPACGVAACRPLAEFWAAQSDIDDPKTRGARLAEAFLTGSGELAAAGFGPFLSVENLSVGSGNIRTNNFDDSPWTLREFKFERSASGARVVPFPIDSAPHGALWNDLEALPAGEQCRTSFIDAVSGLLSNDPAEMAFIVDKPCLDAESQNDFLTQDYPSHLGQGSGSFRAALEARLSGTGLTPEDIAARARFAGSCIGCHEEANGVSLGLGVSAPFSNGFVHVAESFSEDCGDGSQCFGISPALKDVFLPRRLIALEGLLGTAGACSAADAGVVDGGSAPPIEAGPPPPPPPPLTADAGALPSPDGGGSGRLTLGGQPVGVTH